VQVDHRPQAAPDQPLDFLRASALLAFRGLAVAAGMRRARQHRVLGGDPALAFAAQERRDPFLDARSDQHACVAEADQHRAFGVLGESGLNLDDAHLVGRAAGRSHGNSNLGIAFLRPP
jgi:hypothetical protein